MTKDTYTITRREYEGMKKELQEIRAMAGVIIGRDDQIRVIEIWEQEERMLGVPLEKIVIYRRGNEK